jgi:anti-sigma28 factor (negative regulator of flagellin synthesis)
MEKQYFGMARVSSCRQPQVVMKTLQGRCPDLDERQEKIQSLSKAIRNNAYRLDCRKLADCLIASLLLGLPR